MAGNPYFQFKKFRIEQDRCAMKVCTDACAFGAWADLTGAGRILDIGAGTGVLSLMAAQRNPAARIDAVEIDGAAAAQAERNVRSSPFAERISVHKVPIQDFQTTLRYDAILVNPPFYQNSLRSPDAAANQAHHALSLTLSDLLDAVERLLAHGGTWHVLLPVAEGNQLMEQAGERGWYLRREGVLSHSSAHRPFRLLRSYAKVPPADAARTTHRLAVYEPNRPVHTFAFRELLRDFYLNF